MQRPLTAPSATPPGSGRALVRGMAVGMSLSLPAWSAVILAVLAVVR
jgi:hypothetical protein